MFSKNGISRDDTAGQIGSMELIIDTKRVQNYTKQKCVDFLCRSADIQTIRRHHVDGKNNLLEC